MRKLWGALFIFLGIFLAFQTTTTVQAKSFQIEKYHVNAQIQKNGDIDLTQQIEYHFHGKFHGVYYNQDLKGIKGAETPQVWVKTGQKTTPLTNNTTEQDNTFKVNETNDRMDIKVYHAVQNETATFIYKYRLDGAITNYLDTAEMNWKIIGNGWEKELNNVKLTVQLPKNNVSQLQAWSHGFSAGYTKVDRKNGRVIMTLKHNPANTAVESHIIFPTLVTPDNQNIVNKKMKSKILAAEKQLAIEANIKRRNKEYIYRVLMAVGFLVVIVIYLFRIVAIRKDNINQHIVPTPLYHLFEEPKFVPSFTKVLLDRSTKADGLSLTADLLYEVNKRRMKIESSGRTYLITALVPPTNKFFKYLIEEIGDGQKVTVKQIKQAATSMYTRRKVNRHFTDWSKAAAKNRAKYLDLHNISIVDDFKFSAVATDIILAIMFVISVIFGKSILLTGIVALMLGLLIWSFYFIAKRKIVLYTDEGAEEINRIKAFKSMLQDIDDIKLAQVGDIILWEQFLPYAVAFGVSDKVIKALKVNFGKEAIKQSEFLPYYMGSASFLGTSPAGFQTAFVGAISAGGAASSTSGGSGGFSGGSSGGFGGGSGGGAF